MLFFCVFLRESAPTAAKSRTNRSTNSEKATNRLGRLTQNMAHMCKFILEWIYVKQIAPRDTRGAVWGVLGGQQLKSLGKLSDWHQLWFTSADIRQTNCLSRYKGTWGVLGVKHSKAWASCQTVGPIDTKSGSCLRIHLGVDIG